MKRIYQALSTQKDPADINNVQDMILKYSNL